MIKQREEYDDNIDNENNDYDDREREQLIDIPEENKKLISLSTEKNIKY